MQVDKALVVARREYRARIRSKGFWISTAILPLLLVAMGVIPALIASGTSSSKQLVVVDETGRLANAIAAALTDAQDAASQVTEFTVEVEPPSADRENQRLELDRRILDEGLDAWLWITEEDLERGQVEYHAESVSAFVSQGVLESRLTRVVRRDRLSRLGVEPQQADRLVASVGLRTVRVSTEGSKEEREGAGFVLAYALFLLLYVMLMIYGQQVMNGVLEEKTSRIVEVVVSTTRPFELMAGKIAGVCGIALTQLVIWLGSLAIVTLPGIVATMAWLPDGMDVPHLELSLVAHFILLFLIGFIVYSTFYAAIGAAFNSVQEAQQFAGYAVIFLVAPMLFFIFVINDPDSTLSVVTSLIPPFTPLIMLLRLAVKTPPLWQIVLGYVLSIAFAVFMAWLAGRIYRIGILMYGKKPTVQELWRWLRYS
jgi:ABC-2 type transport system permease protein